MAQTPPARADVVIVGGGIIGASIAYHLTELGVSDVVLLERRQFTCGTTWHAAGLVPQLRATRPMTELAKYSAELFEKIAARSGQATGFRQNGSIAVALNDARFEELRRGASMARAFELEAQVIGPAEIKSRYPLIEEKDIVGGLWLPGDGQTNPVDTTAALMKCARMAGARLLEGVEVETLLTQNGKAIGVKYRMAGRDGELSRRPAARTGEIMAGTVVLATGLWSNELARQVGVRLPVQAAEHFYVVTEAMAELPKDLPTLRVPDEWAYYKEDAGKLLIGAFEPVAKPWGLNGVPEDFCFDSLPDDYDHFEPVLEKAIARLPALERTGIATWFNGPESFTPDDQYLLGETAEVADLFVACGFNSIGIQSAGGAGKMLASWIVNRQVPGDIPGLEVRRMHPIQGTRAYLTDRTTESLGLLYAMHWPARQYETARNARRTPFHDRLLDAGAVMGELHGWERPNWYASQGEARRYEYSFGHQNWFDAARRECEAVRDAVALFDQSSMAKYRVQGRDACRILNRLSTANVDTEPGRIIYTQWLNPAGGIEADLTIIRLARDCFQVITSVAAHIRDLAWLRASIDSDDYCTVTDVSAGYAMLGLMGPNSRALLAEVSGMTLDSLGGENFGFAQSREIEIGYAIVRASRITYVGELGWELLIPADMALHVYERLLAAGPRHGLIHAGFHAMNACRIEKAYRHWGHDIGVMDTPVQAGLSFTCDFTKPGGFVGDNVVRQLKEQGPPLRRLVQIKLSEPELLCHQEEPIWVDDKIAGTVTSGGYGHRIAASLAMGYITQNEPINANLLASAKIEVEVANERVPASAQLGPWYDPKMTRIKC